MISTLTFLAADAKKVRTCHLLEWGDYRTDASEGSFQLYYLRSKEKIITHPALVVSELRERAAQSIDVEYFQARREVQCQRALRIPLSKRFG